MKYKDKKRRKRKSFLPIRHDKYSLYEILRQVRFLPKKLKFMGKNKVLCGKDCKVNFDGHMVNMASDRLKLFFNNHTCIMCGIEGSFFALESNNESEGYHFNLYALDSLGNEILMTKDHIIPKSHGGKNRIDNYQTMCTKCNSLKGDQIINDI